MNDLVFVIGEISLVREVDIEQKVIIKYDKNCNSIGIKGIFFCLGDVRKCYKRGII